MNARKIPRPSAALVVATIALFVALGGTAGAIVDAAVPLAKRALTADNAKKLGGKTAAQITSQAAAAPGPASTAAGVVSVKSGTVSLPVDGGAEFTVSCDAGQKVAGGGFSSDGSVFSLDSFPASDSSWRLFLANGSSSAAANITLYATCLR